MLGIFKKKDEPAKEEQGGENNEKANKNKSNSKTYSTEQKQERKKKREKTAQARKEAAAARKAAQAEIRKDKEELYKIRKNRALRVVRVILWGLLIFFFVKGVIVSLRPDPTKEVNETIAQFRLELAQTQDLDNEALAFAENFAVNYLTYSRHGEEDYKRRLQQYAATTVINTVAELRFTAASATVLYSQAYKKIEYSENQLDVYVLLSILYEYQEGTGQTAAEYSKTETVILRVPLYVNGNTYIVEDLPAFVNDSTIDAAYKAQPFSGTEVSTEITNAVQNSLANFYKAYYEEEQGVIAYYLAPDADAANFRGLYGRVTFGKIQTCRVFYATEQPSDKYIAIVTLTIIDTNGVEVTQSFNISLVYKDGQYYIQDMNVRTANI